MNKRSVFTAMIVLSIVVTALLLLLLYRRNLDLIMQYIRHVIEFSKAQNFITTFAILMALQMPHYLFFLPGKGVFCLITTYIYRDFWYIFLQLISTSIVWSAITYYIFGLFKHKLINYVESKPLYKLYESKVQEAPWKTSILIRFSCVPHAFKSLLLIIFNVSLPVFLGSMLIHGVPQLFMIVLVGMSVSSIEDIYNGSFESLDPKVKWFRMFFMLGIAVSMIAFAGIAVFSMYNHKKLQNTNEHKLNLETANVSEEADVSKKLEDSKTNN